MKKITFFFMLLICSSFTISTGAITEAERNFAVKHLNDTRAYLQNAIKGLSQAQINFKSSPERWSILECLEHITNTETALFSAVTGSLAQPANPEKRSEIKVTDEQLINFILDRSGKAKAPEILQPTGKYATIEAALDIYTAQRDKTIQFIKTTTDDMRNHIFPHPAFGMIDSYQWILLVGAHQKRHTLQIEEVKADKNFPKQ